MEDTLNNPHNNLNNKNNPHNNLDVLFKGREWECTP